MIPNSLLSDDRLGVIRELLNQVRSLDGCAIEVGCYQCGLLAEIGRLLPHKSVYGFDTFEGLPDAGPGEGHCQGEFAFSISDAWKFIEGTGMKNIGLVKGLFPESIKTVSADATQDLRSISFAHLDVDYGAVMKECLEWVAPRVVRGGVIVIDDYGNPNCPNVRAVVDDFMRPWPVGPEWGSCVNPPQGPVVDFTIHRAVPWQCWLRRKS